ncbi:MAG: anti-sigma factor [Bradymonadaceae bacterium]
MDGDHPIDKLSAHADGELGDEQTDEVESHLADCEECRRRLEAIRSSKHRLAELGASREPTDALRRKIERRAEESAESADRGRAPGWWSGRSTFLVVATVLLSIGIGYYFGAWQTARTAQVPSEWEELLVRDHLHSKPAAKPMDVTGNDPEAIVGFFRDKVAFEPVVPTVPGAELVGGRLCKLAGEHVQLLFYRHEGWVLSLFVADQLSAPEMCRSSSDHAVCIRQKGSLRLMLVGQAARKQMRTLLKRTEI